MPALTRRPIWKRPTNAGMSFLVTCGSARSQSGPACRPAKILGPGLAASIPVATRGNAPTAPRRPSTWRAPISNRLGQCSWRSGPRPVFKSGAINRLRPQRNIVGSIGASGCRLTGALVADRGWKRRFDEPIPLPRGRQLVTLEDAGTYITKLPKAEHEAAEWQAAMEVRPICRGQLNRRAGRFRASARASIPHVSGRRRV